MSVKRDLADGSRASLYVLLAGAAAIVIVLVLGSMWVWSYGFFTDATANRQGETQKKQQVEGNGAYRIAAYDKFYDDCAGIQGNEDKLRIQRAQLKTTTDPGQQAILNTNISALESIRAEAIRQYNADARKSYTSGQFRSSDLPYQIDPSQETTTCTA